MFDLFIKWIKCIQQAWVAELSGMQFEYRTRGKIEGFVSSIPYYKLS